MRKVSCLKCNKEQSIADGISKAFCKYCGNQLVLNSSVNVITCPNCQTVNSGSILRFCKCCGNKLESGKPMNESNTATGTVIVCSNCAAPVKTILQDGYGKYAICECCGTRIMVDYQAQQAYEVEKAKLKAREEAQRTLLDALTEMEEAALNINDTYKRQNSLVKTIDGLNRREDKLIRDRIVEMYVYPGLITLANFIFAVIFHSVFGFAFLGALSIGAFIYFTIKSHKERIELAKRIEENERELLEVIDDLNAYNEVLNRHKNITIPKDMMNKEAYDTVLGLIAENNIDTLAEAVSLYRYYLQKQNHEKMKAARQRREKERRVRAKDAARTRNAALGLAGIGVGLFAAGAIIKSLLD